MLKLALTALFVMTLGTFALAASSLPVPAPADAPHTVLAGQA